MAAVKTRTNEDGSVFTVRTFRGLIGAEYVVTHSEITTAGGSLMRMDLRMYYLPRGERGPLVPITNEAYRYASTDAEGAEMALAFFVDSYASTLEHARSEGIDVRECFAAE